MRPSSTRGSNGACMPSTPTVSMCAHRSSERPPPAPRATATALARPGRDLVDARREAAVREPARREGRDLGLAGAAGHERRVDRVDLDQAGEELGGLAHAHARFERDGGEARVGGGARVEEVRELGDAVGQARRRPRVVGVGLDGDRPAREADARRLGRGPLGAEAARAPRRRRRGRPPRRRPTSPGTTGRRFVPAPRGRRRARPSRAPSGRQRTADRATRPRTRAREGGRRRRRPRLRSCRASARRPRRPPRPRRAGRRARPPSPRRRRSFAGRARSPRRRGSGSCRRRRPRRRRRGTGPA